MDKEILEKIHELLAKDMLSALQEGGLKAADWAAISKHLKENGVTLMSENIKADEDIFGNLVKEAEMALPAEFRRDN